MGIGVSNWTLARAVSRLGQLGVVSGTAIDSVFIRRLQDGDIGGHIRRAMQHFPMPDICEHILRRYFRPHGRADGVGYALLPMRRKVVSTTQQLITILANFVEVWLAKEGHSGLIGINLLTKVQMPNLASLYGAILAKVDYVLMGAGIPREIPAVLDALAEHRPVQVRFDVEDAHSSEAEYLKFDPNDYWTETYAKIPPDLTRPYFFPIVSANSLAATLVKKATGRVDGLVIEHYTAGGHNAPPRGELRLSETGEPLYGDRDIVNMEKIRALGVPFWLAGGVGSPERLRFAQSIDATGVQVGTLFAYCNESGVAPELKSAVLAGLKAGTVTVHTDPLASPTGYPFKIVDIEGVDRQDDRRVRKCDLGYLRTAYRRPDGRLGYRCASEPVEDYIAKGGRIEETVGRRCLCNGLMANIGHAQPRGSALELPLLTSGDDLLSLGKFLGDRSQYSAADVVSYLLRGQ